MIKLKNSWKNPEINLIKSFLQKPGPPVIIQQPVMPIDYTIDSTIPNTPIDICVMWVDSSSERWQKEYEEYKKLEITRGTQVPTCGAAFNPARYQDWGIFNYWFRGVEKNCPWVNKVFLIVEDEDQVPKWLNKNHPKLRIVYHKEFIPNDLLPMFNGPAIEMWYSNIPDLSENFISCDDDYFFYNLLPEDTFFENNVPQTEIKKSDFEYQKIPGMTWHCMMANDEEFIQKISGQSGKYRYSHLPEARKKSFEAAILAIPENYTIVHDAVAYSHFRSEYSYSAWIFIDLMKVFGISKDKPIYHKSKVLALTNTSVLRMSYSSNCEMICFNDIAGEAQPEVKEWLHNTLKKHFPSKSSFEL